MNKRTGNIACAAAVALLLCISGCGGSSSSNGRIRYVALGASDADGIGASPITNGYVFQIEEMLNQDCIATNLTNLSIPGTELNAVRNVQIPLASELNPDLITLWPGPNDLISGNSLAEFEDDLDSVKQQLLERTDAEIFFATIPDLRIIPSLQSDPDPDVTLERINAYNAIIRATTTDPRIHIVELEDVVLTPELINDIDGFHPSDAGHALLARYFLDSIRPVFCRL